MTQSELKELLYYDSLTGKFTWLASTNKKIVIGTRAGSRKITGYREIKVNNERFTEHQLAWLYVYGYIPTEIDHIDHNRSNNILTNLREVTHIVNCKNRSKQVNNVSGFTGVCFYTRTGKWEAKIKVKGKTIHLGSYTDKVDAIKARQEANVKYAYHANHGS